MTSLTITTLATFLLGGLYLALIAQVIIHRRDNKVAFGDGDNKQLRGAIRAQVNAGEQMPLFLIALGLCEYGGVWSWWLVLLTLAFIIGRGLNAWGMSFGVHQFRVFGTIANLLSLGLILFTLLATLF